MRATPIVGIIGLTVLTGTRMSAAQEAPDPQPPAVRPRPMSSRWTRDLPFSSAPSTRCCALLQQVGSVPDHRDDPAIARALALLEPLGINVPAPITVVHTATPVAVRSVAIAWTDGTTISVNNQGNAYRRALRGDAIPLAAALAHEAAHASGADENAAYIRQIKVLKALGAKRSDIEDVERGARLHR